jgi:hypothetical protein
MLPRDNPCHTTTKSQLIAREVSVSYIGRHNILQKKIDSLSSIIFRFSREAAGNFLQKPSHDLVST